MLRQVGTELFVAGEAEAHVELVGQRVVVTEGSGCQLTYNESPSAPRDRPGGLTTVTVNHGFLKSDAARLMPNEVEHLFSSVLRKELRSTGAAASASGLYLADEVFFFGAEVGNMRDAFVRGLRKCVDRRVLHEEWLPPLWSDVGLDMRAFRSGHIYSVLKAEGVELAPLKAEVLDLVRQMEQSSIIAPQNARAIRDSFGD